MWSWCCCPVSWVEPSSWALASTRMGSLAVAADGSLKLKVTDGEDVYVPGHLVEPYPETCTPTLPT